ncbi:MAG: hypothetical protein QOF50_1992, partial [Gaiellaceae bacterium]|nr:hypothetical protein [Gaiellaceae bacterium]
MSSDEPAGAIRHPAAGGEAGAADLLIDPQGLVSPAFQMEYVASGATCRGTVTQVGADDDALGPDP